MSKIKYKPARLKTVNLEILDFDFLVKRNDVKGKKFNTKKVEIEFDFQISNDNKDVLEFFLHLQLAYEVNKKKEHYVSLYHSDHFVNYELVRKNNEKLSLVDTELLAHLLGMSILMLKGYYDNITKGYQVHKIILPIFSPIELIKHRYEDCIVNNNMFSLSELKRQQLDLE